MPRRKTIRIAGSLSALARVFNTFNLKWFPLPIAICSWTIDKYNIFTTAENPDYSQKKDMNKTF